MNVAKIVISVVPNKKAKERKQSRRAKNEYLRTHGRTKKQIERFKRRNRKR